MADYQLGVYEKSMPDELPIERKLIAAAEAGYDFMELSIDETDARLLRLDWDDREISALNRSMEKTGTRILSFCLSGHRRYPLGDPDPDIRGRGLEIMEKAVRLAAALGVRIIQLAGYDVYYKDSTEQTARYFEEGLFRSAELAAVAGVTLGFETMETPFMNTVEKALYWVNKINSPFLQIYPDSGNLWNASLEYGVSVTDDLEKGRGHIVAVHLKETRPGVYRELPYGAGQVDFKAVSAKARDLGVRIFNAEFWYNKQDNWIDTLNNNMLFLRERI
jgi:predicted hexulose-6-phosphate isomerase